MRSLIALSVPMHNYTFLHWTTGATVDTVSFWILCLWFRASLIYVNNCPTRCNTNQSIYYSASSLYMFRVSTTPIVKTVTTASGTVQLPPSIAAQKIWPVLEVVVTVLCNPDDGCCWHPKHVQWTCRIINRLLCVVSRWTLLI